jgi:REP-associated tyrosine transposase
MARQARIVVPGQALHIFHRGNNRQDVFKSEQDHQRFIDDLMTSRNQSGCLIHAYVLMPNHYHLLLTPPTGKALSDFMQTIGRRYVRYFNQEYQRSGTLWEGRYKSSLIDSDAHLLQCYRYIEENPVRSNVVTAPKQHQWSSYHHNALGLTDPLITEHGNYIQMAAAEDARKNAYSNLLKTPLEQEITSLITSSVEKGEVLGSDRFHQTIESIVGLKTKRGSHGGDRKSKHYKKRKSAILID